MNKFVPLAALAAVATLATPAVVFAETTQAVREVTEEVAAPVELNAGMMLYASNGYRIAPIYRVNADGNPQVIMNGRLITVPASTVSEVGGKVTTSLSKKEVARAK
jgi:heptaprenylglyceryl phosphate synthase